MGKYTAGKEQTAMVVGIVKGVRGVERGHTYAAQRVDEASLAHIESHMHHPGCAVSSGAAKEEQVAWL